MKKLLFCTIDCPILGVFRHQSIKLYDCSKALEIAFNLRCSKCFLLNLPQSCAGEKNRDAKMENDKTVSNVLQYGLPQEHLNMKKCVTFGKLLKLATIWVQQYKFLAQLVQKLSRNKFWCSFEIHNKKQMEDFKMQLQKMINLRNMKNEG